MPAKDYHTFELMYLLEPFGWQNNEYLFGKLMSVIATGKSKKAFKVKDFMRDLAGELREEARMDNTLATMNAEETRRFKIERIKQIFGIIK